MSCNLGPRTAPPVLRRSMALAIAACTAMYDQDCRRLVQFAAQAGLESVFGTTYFRAHAVDCATSGRPEALVRSALAV